ncbi:MAG: hypothetical protein AB1421_04470 [Pseudomonadota bacterium]
MYSENLVVMLLMAATQATSPQVKAPVAPVVEDARHAIIRSVKEPELVAALSLRVKRPGMRVQPVISSQTLFASAR